MAISSSSEGGTIVGWAAVGLWGDTSGDWGVFGRHGRGDAIVGFNSSEPFATGYFENDETAHATAPVPTTVGGAFGGACMFDVSGNMYCSGSKSAVVPVDNSAGKVALYAVESPKNWFEISAPAVSPTDSAVIDSEPPFS